MIHHPSVLELKYTLKCRPRLAKGTAPHPGHAEEPSASPAETGWEGSLELTWPDYTGAQGVSPAAAATAQGLAAPQAGAGAQVGAGLGGTEIGARPSPQGPRVVQAAGGADTGWGCQGACRSPTWQASGNLVSGCWLGVCFLILHTVGGACCRERGN